MKDKVKFVGKSIVRIDASDVYYRDLNFLLRDVVHKNKVEKIDLINVFGQRYIATNIRKEVEIDILGTPGNDLGAFME